MLLFQALWEGKRLDGRGVLDPRDLDITYGLDWGSVQERKIFKLNNKYLEFSFFLMHDNVPLSHFTMYLVQAI